MLALRASSLEILLALANVLLALLIVMEVCSIIGFSIPDDDQ